MSGNCSPGEKLPEVSFVAITGHRKKPDSRSENAAETPKRDGEMARLTKSPH